MPCLKVLDCPVYQKLTGMLCLTLLFWNSALMAGTREEFIARDRNVDGQLSGEEYLLGRQGLDLELSKTNFRDMDLDQSQSLSQSEFVGYDPLLRLSPVEQEVFRQANAQRAQQQTAPVLLSRILSDYARDWSQRMASGEVPFGHGEDGTETDSGFRRRAASAAMDRAYSGGSENCFVCTPADGAAPASLANVAISGWMNSEGHKRNMLNPEQEYLGVGVARSAGGDLYFTQIFLKLPRERRP
ncbi:MAG: CAP domain-containing protein [Planctomycetaceae bacterium]|nr:CAP domain-containing protein [Planctomycetaceae bacterium]